MSIDCNILKLSLKERSTFRLYSTNITLTLQQCYTWSTWSRSFILFVSIAHFHSDFDRPINMTIISCLTLFFLYLGVSSNLEPIANKMDLTFTEVGAESSSREHVSNVSGMVFSRSDELGRFDIISSSQGLISDLKDFFWSIISYVFPGISYIIK